MLAITALGKLQSLLKSFQRNTTCFQCVIGLDKLKNRNGREIKSLESNVKQIVNISFHSK